MAAKKATAATIAPKEREHLEECVQTIKGFLDTWLKYYWQFRHAYLGDPVTVATEFAFLQVKSEVARRHQYLFNELEQLYIGGDEITDLLRKTVSLEKVAKTQSDNYYKVEKAWHIFYINLHDTLASIQYRLDQEDKQ